MWWLVVWDDGDLWDGWNCGLENGEVVNLYLLELARRAEVKSWKSGNANSLTQHTPTPLAKQKATHRGDEYKVLHYGDLRSE